MSNAVARATFEMVEAGRSKVSGILDFETVSHLLSEGSAAIVRGDAAAIDLAGVTHSDSSGLALLIEWLSVAHQAKCTLVYANMPLQLLQLARLSDVEELLVT